MKKLIFLVFICLIPFQASAETVITLHKNLPVDMTELYPYQALKLALDKTREDYGNYTLNVTEFIPVSRVDVEAESPEHENFFFLDSVSTERLDSLAHVNFPVLLGIVGYRVPFVSSDLKNKNYQINSMEDLKQFSIVQGRGWLDSMILRENGMTVYEGNDILGLYYMVANERGSFFPIGAHQVEENWQRYKDVERLEIDDSIVLYYPLPRFFFTSKQNTKETKRIEEGLKRAYEDGELTALWEKHYLDALKTVNLAERKVFRMENRFIQGIDESYKQYIYDPWKSQIDVANNIAMPSSTLSYKPIQR